MENVMLNRYAAASLLGLLAILARGLYGELWLWLGFNLALAWIPLALGQWMSTDRTRLQVFGWMWLLFLPNAPYLVTDLVHLEPRPPVPHWFDVALLGGFGALGLAMGAASARQVVHAVHREWGPAAAGVLGAALLPAVGVAILIGRFARWNSWDAVTNPLGVLGDVVPLVTDATRHGSEWAFILTYCGLFAGACLLSDGSREPTAAAAR